MGKVLDIDTFKPEGHTKEFGTIDPQEVLNEVDKMKGNLNSLLLLHRKKMKSIEVTIENKLKEFERKLNMSPLINRLERCEDNLSTLISSLDKNG